MTKKRTPLMTDLIPAASNTVLPVDRPIDVYYRQSSEGQIGNVSTAIQTLDLPARLRQLGWSADKVRLIDMDAGISGAKKIDERPGMKELFGDITDRKCGAVACQDEDRLFRDVTQIQVNVFIEACKQANVLVLTPSMIYDFASPLLGTYHARQFRFKCEMAAEYLDTVIRGKLLRARHTLISAGQWAGGNTTPGYMVHIKERRYYPFEPYAEVVNEYFRLFLSSTGNLRATHREIIQHGPYYPKAEPPEGFKVEYRKLGRYPSRTTLRRLLTNPTFIGHRTHNGEVIRYNNHPAIVPVDVFMRAFNYLSPVALNGSENKYFKPFREHARPSLDEERPAERPVFNGMLQGRIDGKWYDLGTRWAEHRYVYVLRSRETGVHVWSRNADLIDAKISELLHERLKTSFDDASWKKALAAATPNYQKERRRKAAQIEALEQTLEGYARNLPTLTSEYYIKLSEKQFEAAQIEHKRLMAELAALDDENARIKALEKLKDDLDPAGEGWPNFSRQKKRVIAQRVISRIEVEPTDKGGTLLIVHWNDIEATVVELRQKVGNGKQWRPEEHAELLKLVGASQIEIAAHFPDRTWQSIRQQIRKLNGTSVLEGPRPRPAMHEDETYDQYVMRVSSTSVRHSRTADKSQPVKPFDISALLASFIASTIDTAA